MYPTLDNLPVDTDDMPYPYEWADRICKGCKHSILDNGPAEAITITDFLEGKHEYWHYLCLALENVDIYEQGKTIGRTLARQNS